MIKTDLEIQEYCFSENKRLLDADATGAELQEFNANVRQAKIRAQDEELHKIVWAACEKADIKQDLSNPFPFAQRRGRIYPKNLRPAAAQRLMNRYESID